MSSLVYYDGTASVTNGSAVVTGQGTAWQIALVEGGSFSLAGLSVPILSVDGDTSLTLAYDWPGVDVEAARYAIARETSQAVRAAWINDRLAQFHRQPWGIGVLPDGRGTLAERDALNPMPTDSYCWLRVEVDQPAELYFKVPTGWLGPFRLSGDVGPVGPAGVLRWITVGWQDATEYQINDGLSHNGTSYRAYVAHVSAPATEPGTGANWQDAWQVTAQGTILIEGTTTTLPPDQPARVEFVPVPGGYAVNFFVPRGLTGNIDGVTPFWVARLSNDADAAAALIGLGATAVGAALFTAADAEAAQSELGVYSTSDVQSLVKMHNHIINGEFTVNQRNAGSKAQPVGTYGYDRWKGHAQGLEQVVEGLAAGTYTLTWGGGGTGSVQGQAPQASPALFTGVTAGNVSVVVPATATRVSLVRGDATAVADPFITRPPAHEEALCRRYCRRVGTGAIGLVVNATLASVGYSHDDMRVTPTAIVIPGSGTSGATYLTSGPFSFSNASPVPQTRTGGYLTLSGSSFSSGALIALIKDVILLNADF